ncbi:MAG: hypothetical protein ACJAS1_001857 [Oleiphilaceae bacterium]|jgi:hypothetical protein
MTTGSKFMNKSDRQYRILTEDLSTRRALTAEDIEYKYDVDLRTIYRDLEQLEARNLAYCVDPNSKPHKWLAIRKSAEEEMTVEMALALISIEVAARVNIPVANFESLSEVFAQARKIMIKTRQSQPNHSIVRFEKALNNINLDKECYMGNLNSDILDAIKDAIYQDCELEIVNQVGNSIHFVKPVQMQVLDKKLILKTKMVDFPYSYKNFNIAEMQNASCIDYCSFESAPRMRNAA